MMRKMVVAVLIALTAWALAGWVSGLLVSYLLYVYIRAAAGQ